MRLRYLHLKNLPPLDDLTVNFGHESLLGRAVSIRFVVGVNGSGKTRLLQALTRIFLCLERGVKPPFFLTLVYDIGGDTNNRTIFWRYQAEEKEKNGFIEFASCLSDDKIDDWEDLRLQVETNPSDFPIRGRVISPDEMQGASLSYAIPKSLLVYTSGATNAWQEFFMQTNEGIELPEEIKDEDERPLNWDETAEARYKLENSEPNAPDINTESNTSIEKESVALFVQPEHLKLVACAVTLVQAVKDFQEMTADPQAEIEWHEKRNNEINRQEPAEKLRSILNEICWLYPVTIGLRINFDLSRWKKFRANLYKLNKLYNCATSVLREPLGQPARTLYFDLQQPLTNVDNKNNSTAMALLEALGNESDKEPFTIFRTLYKWHSEGLLENVTIALKKHGLDDVLLYDWLSDGERVFLGRMSLLHLMGKYPDSLIILDEPETHFNDYWKRRIVDVIDDNLRDTPNEVVISTHSSIALTDVFASEITLLSKKETADGSVAVRSPSMQTFGASPGEIMSKIFEAEDIVGQRANEFLDMVLKLAAYPQQVETVWSLFNGSDASNSNAIKQQIHESKEFQHLWKEVKTLHNYNDENRLFNVLSALKTYVRSEGVNANEITMKDALQAVEKKLGPGYYRFEFNRRLASLE